MKAFFTILISCTMVLSLKGQTVMLQDTLINENFETNPTDSMRLFPGGSDTQWVNYDADQIAGDCVDTVESAKPFGWFWDGDLGVPQPTTAKNYAFTSCSYKKGIALQNYNWLITSPISIPDSTFWLCWRSLSYYGPGYLDGYKVLVSTTSNDPATGAFDTIIFRAAEMLANSVPAGSLNVEDYVLSEGYIHANGYTDTSYYFIDHSEGPPFLHGKFEPHTVNLAAFSGKTVYIAFLHDSQDDFLLQVDDILVSNDAHFSPVHSPFNVLYFNIIPNPVRDAAYVSWKLDRVQEVRFTVTDNAGRVLRAEPLGGRSEGRFYLEMQNLPAGIYFCTLATGAGRLTTKLVKM